MKFKSASMGVYTCYVGLVPSEKSEKHRQRYLDAAHAMQTGVAYCMQQDPSETNPKHLRVGINAAMVEHGALAGLLMRKGFFTEEEYYEALADKMEQEVESYQRKLPRNVTLR